MVSLAKYPLLLLIILVCSYPVFRGMALSIFGGRRGLASALEYFKLPETWSPFRSPWSGDIATEFRLFFFLLSGIGFVAAAYQLCVRFLVEA